MIDKELPGMVAHTFSPSTLGDEAGESLSSGPAWFINEFQVGQSCTGKPCFEKPRVKGEGGLSGALFPFIFPGL